MASTGRKLVARESTRTATGINQLGVKAATLGAFVAVFGVFTTAIGADKNAGSHSRCRHPRARHTAIAF
jgi:hypothetical protein